MQINDTKGTIIKFLDTIYEDYIKEQRILVISLITLCITIPLVFYIYIFNPYKLLNYMPRTMILLPSILICMCIVGITLNLNENKNLIEDFSLQSGSIMMSVLYLLSSFLFFCIFYFISKHVLFHSTLQSFLLPIIFVLLGLGVVYNIFFKVNENEQFKIEENEQEPFLKTILFYIPCLIVDSIDFLIKDVENMPSSTYILLGIMLVLFIVSYIVPFFKTSKRSYRNSILLLKGPVEIEKEILYLNQNDLKEKIIAEKPYFKRVFLKQIKDWKDQMETMTKPTIVDKYNQSYENQRVKKGTNDICGNTIQIDDEVYLTNNNIEIHGKVVNIYTSSETLDLSLNEPIKVSRFNNDFVDVYDEIDYGGSAGIINNKNTKNINNYDISMNGDICDNIPPDDLLLTQKKDISFTELSWSPFVEGTEYLFIKDLPMCKNRRVVCDSCSNQIECIDYLNPSIKEKARYQGEIQSCNLKKEDRTFFSDLFELNKDLTSYESFETMYNPELHHLDHTIQNEDILSILTKEEEQVIENAIQNDSGNFTHRLKKLSNKADIRKLYIEYISNHDNYYSILENVHDLNSGMTNQIEQETSSLIDAINRIHNIYDYNYHYGISFWLYIDSEIIKENSTQPQCHILDYAKSPYIYYNMNQDELVVESEECKMNFISSPNAECSPKIIYKSKQILYQRWNHIVINYDYGTLDVFINNNLVGTRNHINPYIGKNKNKIQIGNNDKPANHIAMCNLHYFNKPLDLKEIKHIYKNKKEACK